MNEPIAFQSKNNSDRAAERDLRSTEAVNAISVTRQYTYTTKKSTQSVNVSVKISIYLRKHVKILQKYPFKGSR